MTVIQMAVFTPSTNAVGSGCPFTEDADGNPIVGTPLSDLKEIRLYGKRFTSPDTLNFGAIPARSAAGGDSLPFDLDIVPGTMGYLWTTAVDLSGNEGCVGAQYVFVVPLEAQKSGLTATYWDKQDFSGYSISEVDTVIDFDCATWPAAQADIPSGTIGPGYFSVRWTGFVTLPTAGTWTFCVDSDDGARLWVDDRLLIDKWTTAGKVKACGGSGFEAKTYAIKLEFQQNGGACSIKLLWTPPGMPETLVPKGALGH